VQVLVSCRHCKRVVLMEQGMDLADLVRLREHLAACRPDDPSDVLRDENLLRHVRVVVVETEQGTSPPGRDGGAPTAPKSTVQSLAVVRRSGDAVHLDLGGEVHGSAGRLRRASETHG